MKEQEGLSEVKLFRGLGTMKRTWESGFVGGFYTFEVSEVNRRTCSSLNWRIGGQMKRKTKDNMDTKIERTERNRKTENILKKAKKNLKREISLK